MALDDRRDLTHDLFFPTLLFAALGAMTWAVRGCSGYGGSMGCIFAGVTWGTAWWFIARDPAGTQTRRYASGWIVLALTFGVGISGARGWAQWSTFFNNQLQTNTAAGEFAPISRAYGFLWLFIAGVPWAGLGAGFLAWCAPRPPARMSLHVLDWVARIACLVGGAMLAQALFRHFPEVFLPLYKSLKAQYQDLDANPNLRRLINDNRAAITHLGIYLGFIVYEAGRRDWRNVVLILTVGLVSGAGWSLCQNWKWAEKLWPDARFNFWRCWETSGGISIGIAYGLAYFLVNRRMTDDEQRQVQAFRARHNANLERFGLYLGLILGLGPSIRCGLKGCANIYLGNEEYWSRALSIVMNPIMLLCLAALVAWTCLRPLPRGFQGDTFPRAGAVIWAVLVTQNILAQLVTGPHSVWSETAFSIYYLLLFLMTAVIIRHYQLVKGPPATQDSPSVIDAQ